MDKLEQRRVDLIAAVRSVLANAGIKPPACAKELSNVLGIAIAQAYRKLNGSSVFTLPQIEAIEQTYGVELLTVQVAPDQLPAEVRNWTGATLLVGHHKLPCEISVGSSRRASSARYAAFLLRGEWFVCLPNEHSGNEPLFDVDEMHMTARE
jgi:hypothetical protein